MSATGRDTISVPPTTLTVQIRSGYGGKEIGIAGERRKIHQPGEVAQLAETVHIVRGNKAEVASGHRIMNAANKKLVKSIGKDG